MDKNKDKIVFKKKSYKKMWIAYICNFTIIQKIPIVVQLDKFVKV
jgi:hypothetical protein